MSTFLPSRPYRLRRCFVLRAYLLAAERNAMHQRIAAALAAPVSAETHR